MDPLSTMQQTISRMTTMLGESIAPSFQKRKKSGRGKMKFAFAAIVMGLAAYAGYQTEFVQEQIASLAQSGEAASEQPVAKAANQPDIQMSLVAPAKLSQADKSVKMKPAKVVLNKKKTKQHHAKKHAGKKKHGTSAKLAKSRSKKTSRRSH